MTENTDSGRDSWPGTTPYIVQKRAREELADLPE